MNLKRLHKIAKRAGVEPGAVEIALSTDGWHVRIQLSKPVTDKRRRREDVTATGLAALLDDAAEEAIEDADTWRTVWKREADLAV